MNGCDYDHLINEESARRSYARDRYTLCAVSYSVTETAECAFIMVSWCALFILKHHSNVCN